jgi:hypothetical protein
MHWYTMSKRSDDQMTMTLRTVFAIPRRTVGPGALHAARVQGLGFEVQGLRFRG